MYAIKMTRTSRIITGFITFSLMHSMQGAQEGHTMQIKNNPLVKSITSNLIWTEGATIAAVTGVVGVTTFFLCRPLFYPTLGFAVFSYYFFRNPDRNCAEAADDASLLVCPADGKVVDIQHDPQNGIEGKYAHKISIFLSPLDVHVQWSPTAGVVEKVTYVPGAFTVAYLPKSSLLNEHNDISIKRANGDTLLVRQIAGTVARRIRCWVSENESIDEGKKIGMIKFGSRVDIFLPEGAEIAVGMGQRVYGGQTILGKW